MVARGVKEQQTNHLVKLYQCYYVSQRHTVLHRKKQRLQQKNKLLASGEIIKKSHHLPILCSSKTDDSQKSG